MHFYVREQLEITVKVSSDKKPGHCKMQARNCKQLQRKAATSENALPPRAKRALLVKVDPTGLEPMTHAV